MFNKDIQTMGLSKVDFYENNNEISAIDGVIENILDEIFKNNNFGISEDDLMSKISKQYQLSFGIKNINAERMAQNIIEQMRFGCLCDEFSVSLNDCYGSRIYHQKKQNMYFSKIN
eukprot:UN04682